MSDWQAIYFRFSQNTMAVEFYPSIGIDSQISHSQDEVYFTRSGSGEFIMARGTAFFAPAGIEHCFESFDLGSSISLAIGSAALFRSCRHEYAA